MFKMEQMKALVEERLTAAVEDVLGIIENVFKDFEEKDSRSKSEIERQNKLLDVLRKPKINLQRAGDLENQAELEEKTRLINQVLELQHTLEDPPQLSLCKEEVPPEQQEWSQEDLELLQIKEEQEETWTSREEEQLQGLEETGPKDSIYNVNSSLYDQHQSWPSHLHQTVENREGEPLPGTSSEHMETEADGEGYGVAEPTNICNMKFNFKSNLTPHMNTYTGDRPHICNFCGKGFNQVGDMNNHMRIHTGEPYSCRLCKKNFRFKSNLTVHLRIHTGEKSYSCSVCRKGFVRSSDLQRHMKTHTGERPYSCSVCGKGFVLSSDLQRHMKTHTGERPYNCTVCGKGFSRQDCVQKHMKTHTGERPYSCSVCGKEFRRLHHVQRHMTTHTGETSYGV